MKQANKCADMQDIRAEIDRIDETIIMLLGERFGYVKAAAKFKKTTEDVSAPERFRAMLHQRRLWAKAQGLSEEMIEKLYRDLVEYFISRELTEWANQR